MPKKLSPKELAALFVEYRELYDKLQEKEQVISEQVLLQGETQKIAGVTATYYKESQEVDYESAAKTWAEGHKTDLHSAIDANSLAKIIISWKPIAELVSADLAPFTTVKPARVVVKVK